MKYQLFIALFFISSSFSLAQKHEVGLFLGGSNVVGDVGSTLFVNPNDAAIGLLYKWNKTPKLAFRASLTYANVHGADRKSKKEERIKRDYRFRNAIREVSAGVEYSFIPFDVREPGRLFSKVAPYVYGGISFFQYDALYRKGTHKEMLKYNSHSTFALPLALGVKTTLAPRFILGFEVGARYTFTDDIDGSNPVRDKAPYESLKFGNTKNKDWYVFTGFTITYTFGKKPCFCPGDK